ncbi:MAG: hypothetical protein ACRD4R_13130 [Candidatus Acidiferrales bacterium]
MAMDRRPVKVDASATAGPRLARGSERGGSRLNLLITLLIVAAMGIGAVKIAPVYVDNFEFQDAINTEAQYALSGWPKKTDDDIRQEVWKKAEDLGIPASPQDIQLSTANGNVSIGLNYSVPIDLYVYQFTLQFHPHADNHTI